MKYDNQKDGQCDRDPVRQTLTHSPCLLYTNPLIPQGDTSKRSIVWSFKPNLKRSPSTQYNQLCYNAINIIILIGFTIVVFDTIVFDKTVLCWNY